MRSGAAIHRFGRQDYELPDRSLCYLRFASWSCVYRSRAVASEGMTDDQDRLEAAYVPADVGFATKPKLATRMIARAIAASVPFKWVAGDTVYGVGDIEQQLRRAGKGYVSGSTALMCSGPGAND